MIRNLLSTLFILFFIYSVAEASRKPAQTRVKGLSYEADLSSSDNEKEIVELEGNVQIIFRDQHLKCQKAVINYRSKSIDAAGDVSMTSLQNTIGGKRVVLDLETGTGVIYDGFVQSASVLFEGTLLLKTSDTEFIADNAKYTTCTNCPESWSFTGTKIRAELGGYAYIQNSTLRFGGFPFFWMPYLVVPLKSDRQSGLLTPDFERSNAGGLTIAESYFWAMSRSQDTTWTLKNYELRGLKGLLNYRYVNAENNYGEFDTALIQDRVFSADATRVNAFRGTERSVLNRWFLKYDHYYEMPDQITHRMSINNASDLQYPKDFPLETKNNGDAAMESRFSFSKTDGNLHWFIDSSYFINLLQSNPLASNNDAVHRLPEVSISSSLSPISDTGLLYNWNLTYSNFARGNFAFDTLNSGYVAGSLRYYKAKKADGSLCNEKWDTDPACSVYHDSIFNSSKDLIRTGQRLDGQASLERPFSVGRLDFLPRLSFRETDYNFTVGQDPTAYRRYVRTDFSSRTIFSKVYDSENSKDRVKHEMQPELLATAIPWISQPDHPFFGKLATASPYSTQNNVSDSDLNSPYGLQFDYNDRTYDRKLITFALTNRLIQKTVTGNTTDYRQYFSWKLAQSYDFYQAEGKDPTLPNQPYSDISSDLALLLTKLHIYQRMNYFPYHTVTNSSSRIRLLNEDNDFLQLGYDLSYNITPGQSVEASTRTEQYSITFKKSVRYLDLLSKVIYDINPPSTNRDQRINSYGVGTQLRLPGECWYIRMIWYRPTGGEENFKFTFDFSFDGQKKAALPESLIDTFSF